MTGVSPKALLAVAFWGSSFVATRVALEAFHPLGLVATRLWIGAVALSLLARVGTGSVLPERGDRRRCLMLGLVLGTHLGVQAWGLVYTSAVNAGWIVGAQPVAIALGAQLLLGQRLSRLGWAGVGLAAAGLFLVTARTPPDFAHARLGDLLQLSTVLTWPVYTLAAARPVRSSGPLRVNAFTVTTAAIVTTLAASIQPSIVSGPGGGWLRAEALDSGVLLAVVFLGLFCSTAALWLWLRALADDGAARTAVTLYAEPFVTLAVAVALLGEPVLPNAVAGGLLVLAGVWLVGYGSRAP